MGKIFFTSDQHWAHTNIIKLCNRQFSSVDDMDDYMVERWNKVVKPKDTVYHLGDFAFRRVPDYRAKLNGTIHLMLGNHDRQSSGTYQKVFDSVQHMEVIKMYRRRFTMCHYAMDTWSGRRRGGVCLFGHSHGKRNHLIDPVDLKFDVGVDCHGYAPLQFDELMSMIEKREKLRKDRWVHVNAEN